MNYSLVMPLDTSPPIISVSVPNAIGLDDRIELDGIQYTVYSVKHRLINGDGFNRSQTHEQETVLVLRLIRSLAPVLDPDEINKSAPDYPPATPRDLRTSVRGSGGL